MKALLLLSGGIDSPVAGKLMIDQGVELVAVHFSNQPFVDEKTEQKSAELARKIGAIKFLIVPHGPQQAEIHKHCNPRYYYILTRRIMFRTAEKLAQQEGCEVLITGENLGQVGSQTLTNLSVISRAVKLPILRPILCNDKNDTIRLAERYETFELSKGPEICCTLGPKNPTTRAKLEVVEREEEKIDVKELVQQALNHTK
ncbi:MAG TPA: hypothetical protein VJG90_05365 [Candidatus Nanoarchaeia archaeon]|nr:hypothetical protein [Candidatus Nanoarchaeia archaeon]